MGIEVNLILTSDRTAGEHVKKFDMECCRVIWDPNFKNPFLRTDPLTFLAIEYNRITIPKHLYSEKIYRDRVIKYMNRGFNIMLVDDPERRQI
jgi:hypothetical protein